MQQYIVRRLALMVPTLFGVTLVIFGAIRMFPGDIVDQMSQNYYGSISDDDRERMLEKYSLDAPVHEQYLRWMGGLARGDLGTSFVSGRSVVSDVAQPLPVSFELGMLAIVLATLFGVPSGVLAAVRQNSWVDHLVRSIAVLGLAVPSFWLALLALGYGYQWFGWTPPVRYEDVWSDPLSHIELIIVPAIVLAAHLSAITMRMTRSAMLEILREDYIRTARSKGLKEYLVVVRHALRSAAVPVITVISLQVPVVIGGTVILETIFSVPGMGRLLLNALQSRDYPIVQGVVLMSAVAVIAINFVVDLSYSLIDPRVKA